MSVEFDESSYSNSRFQSREILGMPKTPRLVTLLMKTGLVKDEKSAGNFFLGVILISVVLTFFFGFSAIQQGTVPVKLSRDVIEALPDEAKAKIYESQK